MGNSLQDALIKAGLADAKQARRARSDRQSKKSKKSRQEPVISESAHAARQSLARKAARDRELNDQRRARAERKALRAQIRQLIEQHRLARDEGELGYHFQDNRKIRKIYVTSAIHEDLVAGRLDIVKLEGRYDVVPPDVAEKIRDRDASCVVRRKEPESETAPDDPYADYKVPDDLMW